MILINAELCKPNPNRDSNYLQWLMDCSSEDDIIGLKTNFEIWLDRIIAAQGDDYWNWSIISAENHTLIIFPLQSKAIVRWNAGKAGDNFKCLPIANKC